MKSFKEFISENHWEKYSTLNGKKLVEQEFNGANGLPFDRVPETNATPTNPAPDTEIVRNGEKWFFGGAISTDPVSSKSVRKYVKNPVAGVTQSIWIDDEGNEVSMDRPERSLTPAIASIAAK